MTCQKKATNQRCSENPLALGLLHLGHSPFLLRLVYAAERDSIHQIPARQKADDSSYVGSCIWLDSGDDYKSQSLSRSTRVVPLVKRLSNMIPSHGEFTVGWVTTIRKEYTAARQVLDEEFETTNFVLPRGDRNTYTYGRIGSHYVLITCLESAQYGISSASDAADDMRSSFPMIRLLLIVGIAGGIPTSSNDIRLGDIVVGTEIVRYVRTATDELEHFTHVEPPGRALFTGTQGLAVKLDEGLDLHKVLEKTFTKTQKIKDDYQQPRNGIDLLWKADFDHGLSCECLSSADETKLVYRPNRPDYDRIKVHSGRIGSTDKGTRDAGARDDIGNKLGILCSKEEPASPTNTLPCLHIRGICDYADSHNNNVWKGYAAASASIYAKQLLQTIAPEEVWRMNISIDIKTLQRFVDYLVYEVSQATNISARLVEQKTRLVTISRALRGVKTGVELLVQLSQEAVNDSKQLKDDSHIMRERWKALAASQGDLRRALSTLGMHVKNLQNSVSAKGSKMGCDSLYLRVQTSAAALHDLSNMIKPFVNNVTYLNDQGDLTPGDVASIAASESTRKSSQLTQLGGKFSELSGKVFTKPERHVSKQSISESTTSKETDDAILSQNSGHRKGHRWSNVFRKEDHNKQDGPCFEGEKPKGVGMGWRYSFQTMKDNMSRSDVSILQEKRSVETIVKEHVRPDSPQELPDRASLEIYAPPMPSRSPHIPPRPALFSPNSTSNFSFGSVENLRDLGSECDVSELDFNPRKEVLNNHDDRGSHRFPSNILPLR